MGHPFDLPLCHTRYSKLFVQNTRQTAHLGCAAYDLMLVLLEFVIVADCFMYSVLLLVCTSALLPTFKI